MEEQRFFTLSQVAQHNSKEDCWLVINGRVLDVTKFLEEHPGGEEVLLELAGKDATKEFDAVGHSKEAHNLLPKYQVGATQGATVEEDADSKENVADEESESKSKEMSAFVIKEEGMSKSAAFYEFFVPMLVVILYFSYRCLTMEDPVTY